MSDLNFDANFDEVVSFTADFGVIGSTSITVDQEVTEASSNPVASSGIYSFTTEKVGEVASAKEDKAFVCTYGTTSYADVLAAYNAGKQLILLVGVDKYYLTKVTQTNGIYAFEFSSYDSNLGLDSVRLTKTETGFSWDSDNHDSIYATKTSVNTSLATKQDTLVSGTNIKTINGQSVLGNGNLVIEGGSGGNVDDVTVNGVSVLGSDKVARVSIPTNVSSFTNDAGYITENDIPTIPSKTSELVNDSDYTTTEQVAGQLDLKQDVLTAGANITISEDNVISATGGSGGSTVTMADNAQGGVDLTVDGTSKTLAKQTAVTDLNSALTQLTTTVNGKANSSDLQNYATKTELNTKANDSVVVKTVNGVAPTNGNVNVSTDIPEEVMATQINNYLDTHGGVYASEVDFVNLKNKVLDESPNLFDKTSSNLKYGYFSGSFHENSNYVMTHPIRLTRGVSYKYPQSSSLGSNVQVPYFTAEGGEIGTSYVAGTLANGYVTITFGIDVWARFNIGRTTSLDTFMVCKTDEYPTQYVEYGTVTYSQDMQSSCADYIDGLARYESNPLSGKKIIFEGDSICYGANDSYGGGWGRRIGERNSMEWSNLAETGATITPIAGKHNVSTYIDTIHSRYSELDYYIFDGGTNDADRYNEVGDDTIGTFTADDFSGSYDTTTFSGSFETLLYKVMNYYPTCKVGYIIAPKMGVWTASQNKVKFPPIRVTYFERAKEICKKWGVPYLDLWNDNQINPALPCYYNPNLTPTERAEQGYFYTTDCQHPTANGYEFITPMINDWIKSL